MAVEERYDPTTVALHWLTALLVFALWGIAQAESLVPKPDRHLLWSVHFVIGAALVVVLIVRVGWRASAGLRLAPSDEGALGALARATHWLLYALVVLAFLLGIVNLAVRGWDFGGVVTIPGWAPDDKALRRTINDWHALAANTTIVVVAFHAAAALVHHYVLHDGVLRRMMLARARR